MDASPPVGTKPTGPLSTIKAAVKDGIDRYRALKDAPESRKLLLAIAGTRIGYRASTVALVALSYQLGEGALGVGGMLAILMGPSLLIQPFAGSVIDRFTGKRMLMLTGLVTALLAASFMVLSLVPSLWLLYAITLVLGIVQTFDMPATEVRLMLLTRREMRGTANAVQVLSYTAGEIIGPVIGGILLALAGVNAVFALQVLILLGFVRVVAMLPERVAGATVEHEEATSDDTVKAPGYHSLLRRSDVRLYSGLVAASSGLMYGVVTLYIVRANELGLGDGSVGLFYTMAGIGALFGGILAGTGAYATNRALGIAGIAAVVVAVSVIVFGAAGTLLLAMLALILSGVLSDIEEVAGLTYFQNRLPEVLYGRFYSLFLMAGSVGGLGGSLGGPILADRFGTAAAMTTLAVPAVILGLTFAIREGGFRFALPPFAPEPEPEVVGHGLFTQEQVPDDPIEQHVNGQLPRQPRASRLV